MKRVFILSFSGIFFINSSAQSLYYVIFSGGAELSSISFITDQQVVIKMTINGNLIEWGNDLEPGRFYSQPGKLQPYMGRVEYYENQFDSILNGKVKSIGTTNITYYGSTEQELLVGKVRSIGRVPLDYYNNFQNESLQGKLKTAGSKTFDYYTSFENEALRGKIKMIGSSPITYYSTFDDKAIRGKIKSIGSFSYTWYTSLDRQGYAGAMKTGLQRPVIEGTTFILW